MLDSPLDSRRSEQELSYRAISLTEGCETQDDGSLFDLGCLEQFLLIWPVSPAKVQHGIPIMAALSSVPEPLRPCPFCGLVDGVPHETQEGCIAALQTEIGRMRGILAHLTPAGARVAETPEEDPPVPIRLALD